MKKINLILLIIYLGSFFSCSLFKSRPPQNELSQLPEGAKLVQCESHAEVKDLSKNKNYRFNIDLLAVKNQRMRIEVSGTLGYNVASILFDDSGTKYISYPEKKYFQIKNSRKSLNKLLKVPLSSSQFYNVLYDLPMENSDWKCSQDNLGRVVSCLHPQENLKITWEYFESGEKAIQILGPLVEINWKFGKMKTDVQYNPAAFILDVPQGFKTFSL